MFLRAPISGISGFISRENEDLNGAILTFRNNNEIYIFHIEGLIRHNFETNITKAYKFVGDTDVTDFYANNYSAFTWNHYGILHIVDFEKRIVYYPCRRLNDLWLPYSNDKIFGAICISTKIARRLPFVFSIFSAVPIQSESLNPGIIVILTDRFDLELTPLFRKTYHRVRLNLVGSEIASFDLKLSFPAISKADDKSRYFEMFFDPISGIIEGPFVRIRRKKKKYFFDVEACL